MKHHETDSPSEGNRPAPHVFLPIHEVIRRVGLSRATIYRKIDSGEFPKPVPIGSHRIFFVEAEIVAWQERLMEARP